MSYNTLLTDGHREYYKPLIERMFETCPEMMARKIKRANVQQAFVLATVEEELKPGARALSVGCFEDTAYETMLRDGKLVVGIDPDLNVDLHTYTTRLHTGPFDVVFSTSVIEHVEDDEQFIKDVCFMLKPGGLAVLTCDFNNNYKPGDKLPYSDLRFYTEKDLKFRLGKIIHKAGCEWVDTPDWTGEPDFIHDGCNYSFATMVFRKSL